MGAHRLPRPGVDRSAQRRTVPPAQRAAEDRRPTRPRPIGRREQLDFELELGIWIGPESQQGQPIPIGRAAEHVAGYCLLNDWSARDVQSWEYQPLGPFLSKNFATTVSAWVVTPEALAPYRLPLPARPAGDPEPLPYLRDERDRRRGGLDVDLEVLLSRRRPCGTRAFPRSGWPSAPPGTCTGAWPS